MESLQYSVTGNPVHSGHSADGLCGLFPPILESACDTYGYLAGGFAGPDLKQTCIWKQYLQNVTLFVRRGSNIMCMALLIFFAKETWQNKQTPKDNSFCGA